MLSVITTHILDTARGVPAANVETTLEWCQEEADDWLLLGTGATDADGRIRDWTPVQEQIRPGMYRLTFDTGTYFAAMNIDPIFYPRIRVEFCIPTNFARPSYHIPLLLSPYGYSTYRGS